MSPRRRFWPALVLIAVVASPAEHLRAFHGSEQRLTWPQAAPLLSGHHVELRLTDRARVWGRVLSADSGGLSIDVERTTRADVYPKSIVLIPGASVALIKRRKRSSDVEARGAGIGGAAIAPLAHGLGASERASNRAVAAMVIGAAALGAWVAHRIAGPTLVIRIAPDANVPVR